MIWYKHLYVGKRAEVFRLSLIRTLQQDLAPAFCYVLTPPSNENNVLDIHPADAVVGEDARKRWHEAGKELYILGVAYGYQDACELAAAIVDEVYRSTGGFDLQACLNFPEKG